MDEPYPETKPLPDSPVGPSPDPWGRRRARIALFLLHITALVLVIAITPGDYAFQLGVRSGFATVFGTVLLWLLLYSARTRRPVLVFGILALAQCSFIAFVGIEFRAEKAALRTLNEMAQRRDEWKTQMAQFSMDRFYEALSGKRPGRTEKLLELEARARAAQTKLLELNSETTRWLEQAESRLAAVNPVAARDFRRGVESEQPESDKTLKLTREYFTEIEHLTGFLVELQGGYRMTTNGLVFDRAEDAKMFKNKADTVTHLAEEVNIRRQRSEEALQKFVAGR